MCGGSTTGFSVEFSDHHVIDAGEGRFVSVQLHGQSLAPHLEKHCPHCGFGWLEEVKNHAMHADMVQDVSGTVFTSED